MQQLSLLGSHESELKEKSQIEASALFEAYYHCRNNKRNTMNALAFEIDYEQNLLELCEEINKGTYQPGRSIAFVINKPVQREIFAADFRDRVVHHFLINQLNPLFEKTFIYDNYACRVGKGTHFGIQRLNRFIRQCSNNYSTDCYILKLDIKSFFMGIDKNILLEKLRIFIHQKYIQDNKALVLDFAEKLINNNPTERCIIKGKRSNWNTLPHDKSLFYSAPHCGLPIGNLTSQIFANFYMNSFDHFIKHDLGIRFYGRYVDDFALVHQDKAYLKSLITVLKSFLQDNLRLRLHPKKIYLQHYSKGVNFLGVTIKPNRIYVGNRIKSNFYTAIAKQNAIVEDHKPLKEEKDSFLSSMNSYLGMMKHYQTYTLRKKILSNDLHDWWLDLAYLDRSRAKFSLKRKTTNCKKQESFYL